VLREDFEASQPVGFDNLRWGACAVDQKTEEELNAEILKRPQEAAAADKLQHDICSRNLSLSLPLRREVYSGTAGPSRWSAALPKDKDSCTR
jgi:hypothetical protein